MVKTSHFSYVYFSLSSAGDNTDYTGQRSIEAHSTQWAAHEYHIKACGKASGRDSSQTGAKQVK